MNNVKKSIGWADYTVNPVKGLCPMACPYCYARRMYKRYKWNPDLYLDTGCFYKMPKKPSKIFVGSTMELFGPWVKDEWLGTIFAAVRARAEHTFIFLTKQPQNLARWSPFPKNAWVGVSVTNHRMLHDASFYLQKVDAPVRFYSFEPLLDRVNLTAPNPYFMGDWAILGQQTPVSAKTAPRVEWIREIVEAADKASVPVFLKNNLRTLLIPEDCKKPNALMDDLFWTGDTARLRQEWPK